MTIDNLQMQAYKAIRQKIIFSELVPGQKISEKNLEELLQIGRTPVREALIQLRQEELTYTIPQSGTYVSKIDIDAAKNARFIREQLERKIMVECCAKITPSSQQELEAVLAAQEEAVKNRAGREFFVTDNLFHETCYKIAERSKIWEWLSTQNTHLERFRWLRVLALGMRWETILNQHYDLAHALFSKNTEEVSFFTSRHLHLMLDEEKGVMDSFPTYFNSEL